MPNLYAEGILKFGHGPCSKYPVHDELFHSEWHELGIAICTIDLTDKETELAIA